MKYNRKHLGHVLILFSACYMLTGCVDWVSQAVSIINVLMPAITALFGLLLAFGVKVPPEVQTAFQKVASEVVNDLQNVVRPLLDEYKAADDLSKPAILSRIEAALNTTIANFSSILPMLHVPDAWAAKVESVANAILAELETLIALLPVIKGDKSLHAFQAEGGVVPLDAGQFKGAFNRTLKARTGDAEVDKVTAGFALPR